MEKMKSYLSQISKAFGYEYNESFFSYLKSISKPNRQACNREIKEGEGGFRCVDCTLLSNAIFCTDCFNKTKDKHKNHHVLFKPYSNGFCDCGDPTSAIKESFCPEHHGPFINENEIMNYIKTCIDENILTIINPLLKIETELFNMFDELILFISNLYENNLGLFYFVTLKFTENFPFETNHKCYQYDENRNKVTIIKENLSEKHSCMSFFSSYDLYVYVKKNKT